MKGVRRFIKRPVTIEAIQLRPETFDLACRFLEGNSFVRFDDHIIISTLEGDMKASMGDMIIKGIAGEFYPCKANIFESSYQMVQQ